MTSEGVPRWYGKMFHNELVNMPTNEQKRIMQVLTDKTKRTAIKRCIVPGRHRGKIAEGHSVQDAVMRRLTSRTTIMSFSCLPVVPKRPLPDEVEVRHAMTGYFACRKHEELFAKVENKIPDFDNEEHLLLLAYKALLKGMWQAKLTRVAWSDVAAQDPKSDMPSHMARLHSEMEKGIGYYKYIAEEMLGIAVHPSPYEDQPNVLEHIVFRVPSRIPTVAASTWTNGLSSRLTPIRGGMIIERIPQWGCTVYPLEEEHVVVYHFTASDAPAIRSGIKTILTATDEVLQREVSLDLLAHMEDIVVSPEVWGSFSEDKRSAIEDYFKATLPDMGFHIPELHDKAMDSTLGSKPPTLINLFDG